MPAEFEECRFTKVFEGAATRCPLGRLVREADVKMRIVRIRKGRGLIYDALFSAFARNRLR